MLDFRSVEVVWQFSMVYPCLCRYTNMIDVMANTSTKTKNKIKAQKQSPKNNGDSIVVNGIYRKLNTKKTEWISFLHFEM